MAPLSNVMFRCLPVKLSRPFQGGSFSFLLYTQLFKRVMRVRLVVFGAP
jgi:hypothetical protein